MATMSTPQEAAQIRVVGDSVPAGENFDISALPEDAFDETNRIQTR
jgi:hypothetical protein